MKLTGEVIKALFLKQLRYY